MLISELQKMTDYCGSCQQYYYENCGITVVACPVYSFSMAPRLFINKKFESRDKLDLQELLDNGLILAAQNYYSYYEICCDEFIDLFELLCKIKMRDDIRHEIALDIFAYREYSLKRYNNDPIKATSVSCAKNFLSQYSTAINIFKLHNEFSSKASFNRFISNAYEYLNKSKIKVKEKINESKMYT